MRMAEEHDVSVGAQCGIAQFAHRIVILDLMLMSVHGIEAKTGKEAPNDQKTS